MAGLYEVADMTVKLAETMGEGLRYALQKTVEEDVYWSVNIICDVGDALEAIERAFDAVGLGAHTLWREWSDWLWEVLDRAARACVEEVWERARDILEGQLIPAFEGWKEETAKILAPCVLC